MTLQEAVYLVFFDFDNSAIPEGGESVLNAVAREIRSRDDVQNVVITGHTDTSGPERYNMSLSQRRADAVKQALVERGISADILRVESKGEQNPLVDTPDNVREPANRRTTVSFR